jgi:hypothetical protein
MPPTGRRRARNKDAEAEADAPDVVNTPSRKRRRVRPGSPEPRRFAKPLMLLQVNGADSDAKNVQPAPGRRARRASAESDETIENEDGSEEKNAYAEAEDVIRRLKVASYDVGVAIDHNNEIVEQSAQAFAKIAGRTWTFYVFALHIIIGRPGAKQPKVERTPEAGSSQRAATPRSPQDMTIDIDLGPDQQVSRLHAEIAYDQEQAQWFIIVNGRNGLTVDEARLDRGNKLYLHSGNVINVLGTQMMFMLPDEAPVIHPGIRKTLLLDEEDEDEADLPEEKQVRSFARAGRGRGGNSYQGASQPRPPPTTSNSRNASQPGLPSSSQPQQQPGTPIARNREQPQPKSKPSPAYSRGLLLDSAEEIDYSADVAKDTKPPHSYAQMIGQAILSTPEENATLARIYEFIKEKYAYFRFGGGGWQNSIRHNLSLSKHFEKIPRRTDEPGKGMKWQIVPEHRAEYMKKNFHDNRRAPRRVGSSGPNSPAAGLGPRDQSERLNQALNSARPDPTGFKESPRSATPPLSSYPAPNESYTPDRGPRTGNVQAENALASNGAPMSVNSTPTYNRAMLGREPALSNAGLSGAGRGGLHDGAVDSPPTLTSRMYDAMGAPDLFTPLVERQASKHAMYSTVKPPSFYAKGLLSSPAPFWKYVDIGSTPAKPPIFDDASPDKKMKQDDDDDEEEEEDEEEEDENSEIEGEGEGEGEIQDQGAAARKDLGDEAEQDVAQPSSPPLPGPAGASSGGEGPDESPSRTISRPVSRREALGKKTIDPMPLFAPSAPPNLGLHSSVSGPAYNPYAVATNDDEEEEGIDLAK